MARRPRRRDYVHEPPVRRISITDIAARVGVTPERCKTAFVGIQLDAGGIHSPARVDALHQRCCGRCDRGGDDLMMNVGIVNFGRYAQYYREQIGVSPSTTLKGKVQ